MFKIYKLGEFGSFNVEKIISFEQSIDFHPIYQRYGSIWSIEKKQLFIDTIINEFDTPKFYFSYFSNAENPLNTNNKLYAVIDGKQRLEAIYDFFLNKFPLSETFRFYEDESIDVKKLTFKEIADKHPFLLSKFFLYELDIIFVDTDDEDKLEELFLRLNGGEALTNAEKRNAIGGVFNKKVREIVESHIFFTAKLRFKNPRYQYQDLFVKLALIEAREKLVSFKNDILNDFIRDNKSFEGKIIEIFDNLVNNLNDLSNCFDDRDPLLFSKGIIPVYYYFYTRHLPENTVFKTFLSEFEALRKENRKLESSKANPILMQYDRLNQQGVHLVNSLDFRYRVIEKSFNFFKKNSSLINFTVEDNFDYDLDEENIITT